MGESERNHVSKYVSFHINRETGERAPGAQVVEDWWHDLHNNKGDWAALRRCDDIRKIAMIHAYVRLRWKLQDEYKDAKINADAVATIAGVLSHITQNTSQQLGSQMAKPKDGGNASISRLRFSQLLSISINRYESSDEVDDWNQLMRTMIRIIMQLDNRANIIHVANTIFWWDDKRKAELARDYYENYLAKE